MKQHIHVENLTSKTECISSCLAYTLYACGSDRYSQNSIHIDTVWVFFTVLSNCFLFVNKCIELMKFSQLQNIKSSLYPCLARLFSLFGLED